MQGLLGSNYVSLASNTIDYWMLPDDPSMTEARVHQAIERAPVLDDASLSIYVHVPFCAQHCRFCAFSGGNSLRWAEAERYARLVVRQLQRLHARTGLGRFPIRAVNIGGGSPDLLRASIGHVLDGVRGLPGFGAETEVAVEMTLSTTTEGFVDALAAAGVTKVSFGIQSLDPDVRTSMRQPAEASALPRALDWIDGRIPVVNADLITGLPGQSVAGVVGDLEALMGEPRITGISSYLLTAGAAPALVAAVEAGACPPLPGPMDQALMRLHAYTTFLRAGWQRRGTNTYVDPSRIAPEVLARLAGDECIAGGRYESFVLGVGAQAVSMLPGARVENYVDVEQWCAAMEADAPTWHLPACSDAHQRDLALWCFPLRWEHLTRARLDRMRQRGDLVPSQLEALAAFVREGLVIEHPDRLELSILGEVFMGHLVRELKQAGARGAIDAYVRDGEARGRALSQGFVPAGRLVNDRQRALDSLTRG